MVAASASPLNYKIFSRFIHERVTNSAFEGQAFSNNPAMTVGSEDVHALSKESDEIFT